MEKFLSVKEQLEVIRTGVVDLLPEEELVTKLEKSIKENKPLRVKLGCDPSKPDLHVGHAVVLHKMRQFQELGHTVVLIIGDFTGMIGDPTGKSKSRPQLTLEQTKINGQTYLEQATRILSVENLEIRYNSEWLGKMSFEDVIKLCSNYTVAQILERDDFDKRYKSGVPISIHELMYPLAQAMDSVAIDSDIELGGTDQKFNLLVGREIQKAYGKEAQCILTMPILEGTDGVEKMSKSLGNTIDLTDTPKDIFGKTMSIPDKLITRYLKYAAFADDKEVKSFEAGLADGSMHPRDAKAEVGKRIVSLYYSSEAGDAALDEFNRIFKQKDIPDEVEEFIIKPGEEWNIVDLIFAAKLAESKKQAKKLIEQGAVKINSEKLSDINFKFDSGMEFMLKVGKRKFVKVIQKQ